MKWFNPRLIALGSKDNGLGEPNCNPTGYSASTVCSSGSVAGSTGCKSGTLAEGGCAPTGSTPNTG